MAHLHAPIRAGTDIVFLGALISHVLENGREFREYVRYYTNARAIIREDFKDTEELDGLFSGWNADEKHLRPGDLGLRGRRRQTERRQRASVRTARTAAAERAPDRPEDWDLEHPNCVFQLTKRHFARYTPEMVERVCGIPRETFLEIAESLCDNSGAERTSALVYAVGWTQHTTGVQNIRAAAILQLLLGNIGRPGGGILALRGHANIQGSTDIPTLYDILPGYIPMPHPSQPTFDDWVSKTGPKGGVLGSARQFCVSLLKAWFGDAATADNDWCYAHMPRIDGDHSHYAITRRMIDGDTKGYS